MSRISNVGTGGSGSDSGTPGGSTTQVQFNDGGSFGGDAGLVYDKTTGTLTLDNLVLNTDLPLTEGGTGASTAAGARTNLGLIIGTDVQSYSANLDEYAAVNPTAAGLALLDDANAAAQLITLGLTATATELNYTDGVTSAIQTQLDAKAADSAVVHDTGDETIAGVKTFSSDPLIPDEAYGAGWNGSLEPPTKNAVYDQMELKAPLASPTFTGTVVLPTTTAGGVITLSENSSIALDPSLSSDGKYTGNTTIAGTAGATLAFGDLVYLAASDSRWELADADSVTTSGDVLLGICILAAASDGDPTVILLHGNIRADTAFPALTVSAQVYVGTTAGDIQVAQPSGTDDVIRVVGRALTADSIYFNPSEDYITHT